MRFFLLVETATCSLSSFFTVKNLPCGFFRAWRMKKLHLESIHRCSLLALKLRKVKLKSSLKSFLALHCIQPQLYVLHLLPSHNVRNCFKFRSDSHQRLSFSLPLVNFNFRPRFVSLQRERERRARRRKIYEEMCNHILVECRSIFHAKRTRKALTLADVAMFALRCRLIIQ